MTLCCYDYLVSTACFVLPFSIKDKNNSFGLMTYSGLMTDHSNPCSNTKLGLYCLTLEVSVPVSASDNFVLLTFPAVKCKKKTVNLSTQLNVDNVQYLVFMTHLSFN